MRGTCNQLPALKGTRVLVVEDEFFIADELGRMLKGAGARVVGPVATPKAAQAALNDDGFDCAVIDLNLRGESAVLIADELLHRGKPSVIATGYDSSFLPERLKGVPFVEKPFDEKAILLALIQLLDRR